MGLKFIFGQLHNDIQGYLVINFEWSSAHPHRLRVWPYNEAMFHQNVLEIEGKIQRNIKFWSDSLSVGYKTGT